MTDATDVMAQDIEALRRERNAYKQALNDERDFSEWRTIAEKLTHELSQEQDRANELAYDLEGAEQDAAAWRYTASKLQAERDAERDRADALAAHVDELRRCTYRDDAPYITQVLEEDPQTSLARRDARMKAEALEEFRKKHTMPYMQNKWLKNAVAAYCRQAEEAPCSTLSPES